MKELLDLAASWEFAYKSSSGAGDLVNEAEFWKSLGDIFESFTKSTSFPSKSLEELQAFIKSQLHPISLAFTGRSFFKGMLVFVDGDTCEDAWTCLLDNYFKKHLDDLMLFDDLERQIVKSSLAPGLLIFDINHEVWFF